MRVWRALTMLPVPFLALIAVHGSIVGLGGPGAPSLAFQDPREAVLATVGIAPSVLLAALTWAPSRTIRGIAYLGYALALALGFAVGGGLGVLTFVGAADGGSGGPLWLRAALLAGSFLSAAALLPLTHLIVEDWRTSRRDTDRTRSSNGAGH